MLKELRTVGFLILSLSYSAYTGTFVYQTYQAGSRPNYTAAQEICANMGAELAIVDTESEYDRMIDFLTEYYDGNITLPREFWIGAAATLLSNGSWGHTWKQCGNEHALSWAPWDGGEPNGVGTSENCTRIYLNLRYRSIYCHYGYDVMCETKDFPDCSGSSEECVPLTSCWWTPARVGLTAGFMSLGTFLCFICVCWHCFCTTKNRVDYSLDDESDDDNTKNHNIENMPSRRTPPPGINSRVLGTVGLQDTSWMSPEELSFHGRHTYKY